MADNTENEIVDKLVDEGQLIRNTGTNSIKSVNTRLDRFEEIFQTMQFNIVMQSAMLRELIEIDNNSLKIQMEEARIAEDARRLSLITGNDANKQGKQDETKATDVKTVEEKSKSGLLPTFDFAELLQSGRGLLSLGTIFKGGLAAFLSPIIGEFVGDFVEQSLLNANFSQELSRSLGDAADRGAMAATIGSIFGKRAAAVFGAAGFASSFSDEMIDFMGLDPNNMQNILGMEFSNKQITEGILGAAGLAVGTALTSESLWGSIFSSIAGKDGGGIKDTLMKNAKFLTMARGLQLGAAMAVMGLYLAYGDEAKLWLEENAGLPENFASMTVDTVSFAATGASLGAMFGPQGMLIGAAIGLLLGLGKGLYDWFTENSAETEKELQARRDEIDTFIKSKQQGPIDQELYTQLGSLAQQNAAEGMTRTKMATELSTFAQTSGLSPEIQTATVAKVLQDVYGEGVTGDAEVTDKENASRAAMMSSAAETENVDMNLYEQLLTDVEGKKKQGISPNIIKEEAGMMADWLFDGSENVKQATLNKVLKDSLAGYQGISLDNTNQNYQDAILRQANNPLPSISPVIPNQPALNTLSSGTAASSVVYAPVTNAPVTNVYQGGNSSTNSSTVVLGSTGMDLDRPGYAR